MSISDEYSGKTILAVDDDPFIRKMFTSMLGNIGFNVVTAADGAEAVTIAMQETPDVIFLDVMMPGVDGFKTLEMLRNMDQTRQTPIIMATARADTTTLLKAIKLGANDFIAKPFSRTMVMRKVRFAVMMKSSTDSATASGSSGKDAPRPTFINPNVFNEMKTTYINKFDQIFLTMIRYLSNRNKLELLNIIEDTQRACKTYDIDEPLKIIPSLVENVKNKNWDEVTNSLEKIYTIFETLVKELDREAEKKNSAQ